MELLILFSLFTELGMEPGGRLMIGILELIAGVGLLHPMSAALASFLATGILSGALLAHSTRLGFGDANLFFIGYSAALFIVWSRWNQMPFAPSRFKRRDTK